MLSKSPQLLLRAQWCQSIGSTRTWVGRGRPTCCASFEAELGAMHREKVVANMAFPPAYLVSFY